MHFHVMVLPPYLNNVILKFPMSKGQEAVDNKLATDISSLIGPNVFL